MQLSQLGQYAWGRLNRPESPRTKIAKGGVRICLVNRTNAETFIGFLIEMSVVYASPFILKVLARAYQKKPRDAEGLRLAVFRLSYFTVICTLPER